LAYFRVEDHTLADFGGRHTDCEPKKETAVVAESGSVIVTEVGFDFDPGK
jgi:hypothetical protein